MPRLTIARGLVRLLLDKGGCRIYSVARFASFVDGDVRYSRAKIHHRTNTVSNVSPSELG